MADAKEGKIDSKVADEFLSKYLAKGAKPLEGKTQDFPDIKTDPKGSGKGLCDTDAKKALKKAAKEALEEDVKVIRKIQEKMYAEGKHRVLVVLQAMDCGGKDGTIEDLLCGMNPQGVRVQSFKSPSKDEVAHDYLWRIHPHIPAKGMFQVFNRSHYEDVLITKVKGWVKEDQIQKRYKHISDFEQYLTEEGVIIIKCFLNIDKDEQKLRLQARLDDKEKNWKFTSSDIVERKQWPQYQEAINAAVTATNKPFAPWYIVPADLKWQRSHVVARIVRLTLEKLKMEWPPVEAGIENVKVE